jgi:hypothetical protein
MHARHAVTAAGLMGLVYAMQPSTAHAAPLTLSAETVQSLAQVGNSTISTLNRAAIVLQALNKSGVGVTSLGATTGNETSIISLPAGWTLETIFVPPGGCLLQPTKLTNGGGGHYIISLISSATKGTCPWLAGEYLFHLRIQGVNGFTGAVIQKLKIQ